MRAQANSLERRTIALAAVLLGVYNLTVNLLHRPPFGLPGLTGGVPNELMRGGHFLLIVAALTLFIIAPALWHGKRAAWLLALTCGLAGLVAHPIRQADVWGTGASLVFVGALLGARPQFPARSDTPTALRGVFTLLAGTAIVFLYAVVGLYFKDDEFHHAVPFAVALKDGFRLLFVVSSIETEPATRHGARFIASIRFAELFVWFAAALQMLRPVVYRLRTAPHERDVVRQILERDADSALAFLALLPDKSYFFSDTRRSVLAYGVAGDTAIVMGDPLGDDREFKELITLFQQHCELNGWAYAFNQARPRYQPLYASLGLKTLKTGEEGIVDVRGFTLSGNSQKHLRATMNRFEREGFSSEVLQPPHADELLDRLEEISDAWLAQGRRRERRFMLGYFDDAVLQQCELMVARDAEGEIVAFANIVPSYRSTEGNFDMLRYGEEPKAVADFIYISLIRLFQQRGFSGMNLGLAPFSGLEQGSPDSAVAYAMRLLYRYSPFLRYQGLRDYKKKFTSVWEPRYLVYPSDAQLPGIALATMRVGEMPHGVHLTDRDVEDRPNDRWEDASGTPALT